MTVIDAHADVEIEKDVTVENGNEKINPKYSTFRDSLRRVAHNDWLKSNNQFSKRLPGPKGTDAVVEVNGKPMEIHRWTMLYKDLNLIANTFPAFTNPNYIGTQKLSEIQEHQLLDLKDKLKKRFKSTKNYGNFVPEEVNFDYLDQFTPEQLYQWFKDVHDTGIRNNDNWVENAENIISQLGLQIDDLGNLNYKQIDSLEELQKSFVEIQAALKPNPENAYYEELIKDATSFPIVINSMIFAHNNWRLTQTGVPPEDVQVNPIANLEALIYESEEIELLTHFFENGIEGLLKENIDTMDLQINLTEKQQVLLKKILGKQALEDNLTLDDLTQLEAFEVLKIGVATNTTPDLLKNKVEGFKKKFIDSNPYINSTQSFGLMVSMMHSLEIQVEKSTELEHKSKYLKALNYIKDQIAADCNPKIIEGILDANRKLSKTQGDIKEL
jgi:hypothetical protein